MSGVATYTRPNNTAQTASQYKANIDGDMQVYERLAGAFAPHAQSSPNMTVRLDAGALLSGTTLTEVAAQNTGTITAPVSNSRIDRVVIDSASGAVSVITGTPGVSPAVPALTAGVLPICQVLLTSVTTTITNSIITDERVAAAGSSGNPAGTIIDYGGSSTPSGYLPCDGAAVSRSTYATLFTAIGTIWGVGDGSTTFNVPPLNGRATIGDGTGTNAETVAAASVSTGSDLFTVASNDKKWVTGIPIVMTTTGGLPAPFAGATTYYVVRNSATQVKFATTLANAQNGVVIDITTQGTGNHTITQTLTARTQGQIGGEEAHAMSSTELLAHTHGAGKVWQAGSTTSEGPGASSDEVAIPSTGGNAAMNVMPPFAVVKKFIKT